jgi:hypothetical protein
MAATPDLNRDWRPAHIPPFLERVDKGKNSLIEIAIVNNGHFPWCLKNTIKLWKIKIIKLMV